MKMIPGHLYSYDCQDGGNGIFYGIYTYTGELSYRFDYVTNSLKDWHSPTFDCYSCDSDRLAHIGDPSDFPEYFV